MNTSSNYLVSSKRLKIALLTICLLSSVKPLVAQTKIHALEFNQTVVNSAIVTVIEPKQSPKEITLTIGKSFPSGTLFQVPANTVVWLTSNNNRQRLGPGSRHMVSANAKGESHKTFFGMVKHFVLSRLSFYTASGPNNRVQGAVEGTEFTVEAVGHDVKFYTSEGKVAIHRKVPIKIGEASPSESKRKRTITTEKVSYLSAGQPEEKFTSEAAYSVNYQTYEEAIYYFKQKLDKRYYNGDEPGYLAEEYTVLGELYMDNDEAEKAIAPFKRAVDLIEEMEMEDSFEANDIDVPGNYLNLCDALYEVDRWDEGEVYWKTAVRILKEELYYNVEDYNYFFCLSKNTVRPGVLGQIS